MELLVKKRSKIVRLKLEIIARHVRVVIIKPIALEVPVLKKHLIVNP